ncbi:uncharacterized protein LOC115776568 [Archocentrus centrarchus]|uniref:uncharacterized protein LOC115776568 n=1 Tax=Archocentrus centrarchus TaxID=63155 RepID=UPI0011E9B7AB|nr:uncharacterized protein LOC115776568 [Archocentrus centrarchus]
MSPGPASLCWTFLLFVGAFVFVSADQKIITAESGQDVTLPCRAPNNNNNNNNKIIVAEWTRVDLEPGYVLLYRYDQFAPANQHPSFKNRVDLQDRQMKDGDVSVILKDVTTDDEGTYECHFFMEGARSWELSSIYLSVHPPKQIIITAESGQRVSLPCRAPNNNIISVEWTQPDLGDKYVLLYQDENFDPDYQHPSFKNRVDLQDRQMKDGDVSLVLMNVKAADAGTYECRVFMAETRSWERSMVYLRVDPPEQKNIPAEFGQDVTLPCRAPIYNYNRGVEWSRADLEPGFVLFYRDGQFDLDNQHPSFKDRVELQDRQMKDGDVSLVLKDVTNNDAGTYECRVFMTGTNRRKRSADPINIINLSVGPPGPSGGHTEGGAVGLAALPVVAVVLAVVVGFVIYKKTRKNQIKSFSESDDGTEMNSPEHPAEGKHQN